MAHGLSEGQVVAERYRLVRVLGAGGMGAVWLAVHVATGRRVAVKVILPEKALRAGAIERFRREALALGKIESRYVTQVLDAGTDVASGAAYLVMEMFDGVDVAKLIERLGPLPPQLAARIALQAALGLHAAHETGAIHRDVKPANLFLSKQPDGERVVKVLDFGIAKLLDQDGTPDVPASKEKLTATGMVFGSAPYMSPEQVRGSQALDRRTDVWSLGASLYEMLTTLLPFPGADVLQVVLQINAGAPVPLLSRAPWVPRELVAVVDRAMRADPNQRYPTAAAMADDLARLVRGGVAISQELLVSLPEELRSHGATSFEAREEAQPPAPAASVSVQGPATDRLSSPPFSGVREPPPTGALPASAQPGPPAGEPGTLASPQGRADPRRRWTVLAAAGLVVVAGVVFFVIAAMLSQQRQEVVEPIVSPSSGSAFAAAGPEAGASTSTTRATSMESAPTVSASPPDESAAMPAATSPVRSPAPSPRTPSNPFGGTRKP